MSSSAQSSQRNGTFRAKVLHQPYKQSASKAELKAYVSVNLSENPLLNTGITNSCLYLLLFLPPAVRLSRSDTFTSFLFEELDRRMINYFSHTFTPFTTLQRF